MKPYTHFLIHQHHDEQGLGPRQISQKLGIALRTVERHLAMPRELEAKPPRKSESILEPHKEKIRRLLDDGLSGMQILFRLRQDGYQGGKTILHDHIRKVRPPVHEAFLTLNFEPGEMAQVDFRNAPWCAPRRGQVVCLFDDPGLQRDFCQVRRA